MRFALCCAQGAVLVFLPGFADITTLLGTLTASRQFGDMSRFRVLPLHSSLSSQSQKLIFQPAPKGKRKIVIATNLAETSITIADVTVVIDTGR